LLSFVHPFSFFLSRYVSVRNSVSHWIHGLIFSWYLPL